MPKGEQAQHDEGVARVRTGSRAQRLQVARDHSWASAVVAPSVESTADVHDAVDQSQPAVVVPVGAQPVRDCVREGLGRRAEGRRNSTGPSGDSDDVVTEVRILTQAANAFERTPVRVRIIRRGHGLQRGRQLELLHEPCGRGVQRGSTISLVPPLSLAEVEEQFLMHTPGPQFLDSDAEHVGEGNGGAGRCRSIAHDLHCGRVRLRPLLRSFPAVRGGEATRPDHSGAPSRAPSCPSGQETHHHLGHSVWIGQRCGGPDW